MAVDRTHNPQRGPALALVELLNHNLPAMRWDIAQDGTLTGSLHQADTRDAVAAWSAFLEAKPTTPMTYTYNDELHSWQHMSSTWCDVKLWLAFYSSEVVFPPAEEVAA